MLKSNEYHGAVHCCDNACLSLAKSKNRGIILKRWIVPMLIGLSVNVRNVPKKNLVQAAVSGVVAVDVL
jgi:hypothetical protein